MEIVGRLLLGGFFAYFGPKLFILIAASASGSFGNLLLVYHFFIPLTIACFVAGVFIEISLYIIQAIVLIMILVWLFGS